VLWKISTHQLGFYSALICILLKEILNFYCTINVYSIPTFKYSQKKYSQKEVLVFNKNKG
jgi:hypothetical protein